MKRIIIAILSALLLTTGLFGSYSFAAELPAAQNTQKEDTQDDTNREETPVYKTGVYSVDGVQKYFQNGKFKEVTGVVKRISDKQWVYVENGVFKKNTGVAKRLTDKKWVYVKKGVFRKMTGVAKRLSGNKSVYVKNGIFKKYTGLAKQLSNKKWVFVSKGVQTNKLKKIKLTKADEKAGLKNRFVEVYAKAIVANITNDSMTEKQKLKACFKYTINHFASTNNPRIPHYMGKDWIYVYAYDMFGPRKGGNCMSFAAAFAFLAKACGCKSVYAINTGGHGWTEVNGLVYDPEQYHDTSRKIYATKYSDPLIKGYQAAIKNASSTVRKKIKAF